MTPADLADAIVAAVRSAVADGVVDVPVPASVTVERPRRPEHGDYATPVALQLSGEARRPPHELAEVLAAHLRARTSGTGVADVAVAGPGFLNIRLAAHALGEIARTVVRAGAAYGCAGVSTGKDAVVARRVLPATPGGSLSALERGDFTRPTGELSVSSAQFAHARCCSLLRHASELGMPLDVDGADVALLTHPREIDLLRQLGEMPRVAALSTESHAPQRLSRYLEDLADGCHAFVEACRVLPRGDDEPTATSAARLLLTEATKVALANGLWLLGVNAPERM
jgi:arginyl-tRNA synthetase